MHIFEVWKSINYKPGIYDPSGIGWTITVAYFLAAFLCLWTGLAEKKRERIKDKPATKGKTNIQRTTYNTQQIVRVCLCKSLVKKRKKAKLGSH